MGLELVSCEAFTALGVHVAWAFWEGLGFVGPCEILAWGLCSVWLRRNIHLLPKKLKPPQPPNIKYPPPYYSDIIVYWGLRGRDYKATCVWEA